MGRSLYLLEGPQLSSPPASSSATEDPMDSSDGREAEEESNVIGEMRDKQGTSVDHTD